MPDFTIVIATLNAERTLRRCLQSVLDQENVTIQVIMVDGASTDRTREIGAALGAEILVEQKQGIYPALNRGLREARGAWVLIIGADDQLLHPRVLDQVSGYLRQAKASVCYAQSVLSGPSASTDKVLGLPWSELASVFRYRQCLPHGSTFYRRAVLTQYPFDETFKIAGDYEQLARLVQVKPPQFVPVLCTRVALGGISTSWKGMWTSLCESRRVSQTYFSECGWGTFLVQLVKAVCWRLRLACGG